MSEEPNPEQYYRRKYPGFADNAYRAMVKSRRGPLPKSRYAEALQYFAKGHQRNDICKLMSISNAALQLALKYDPLFRAKWKSVDKARPQQAENTLISLILGGETTQDITLQTKCDYEGNPILDEDGKQVEFVRKRVIHQKGPNVELLKFFLMSQSEKFGKLPDETGLEELLGKLQEYAQERSRCLPETKSDT